MFVDLEFDGMDHGIEDMLFAFFEEISTYNK